MEVLCDQINQWSKHFSDEKESRQKQQRKVGKGLQAIYGTHRSIRGNCILLQYLKWQPRLLHLCTDKPTLSSSNERHLKREVLSLEIHHLSSGLSNKEGGFLPRVKAFWVHNHFGQTPFKNKINTIYRFCRVETLYTH